MNREIKFRAYSEKRNQMEAVFLTDRGESCRKGYQWWGEWNDLLNADVMQYTGLKDNNGTEIYEGDIVEHIFTNQKVAVIFEDGCFYTKFSDQYYRLGNWKDGAIKVIGNIHENPELLD